MELNFYVASDFEKVPDIPTSSSQLHLSLLAMVGQTGNLTDDFRLVITGPKEVQMEFLGDDFYPHAVLHPFRFVVSLEPEELVIPVNGVASPWFNLRDLVAAGQVAALPTQMNGEANFLASWSKHQGDASPPGAAVRWIVAVEKDNGMALHLQGVPLSTTALESRPTLGRDDAPAKLLARLPLTVDRIRCLSQESVKPLLYAVEPAKASKAIENNLAGFIRQLCRLWQRFIVPEYLDGEEMDRVMAQPRAGRVARPYGTPRAAPSQPTAGPPPSSQDLAGSWLPLTLYASIAENLSRNVREKIISSVSESTWNRYLTAWRLYEAFCTAHSIAPSLPIPDPRILDLASWLSMRPLSAATVKTYIGSLSQIQQLANLPGISVNGRPLLKRFLKGLERDPEPAPIRRRARRAVSLPLLRILGHYLAGAELAEGERQMFWAVALAAFFGSLRIGELLADKVKRPASPGLLWADISWVGEELFLRIRSHKTGHESGDLIILFPLQDKSICPVTAFRRLAAGPPRCGPVFTRAGGGLWTKQHFSSILQHLMQLTNLLERGEAITGHSFRAGIPSALGALGTADSRIALTEWGRWRSGAFAAYTRQHVAAKRAIFRRIETALLSPTNV